MVKKYLFFISIILSIIFIFGITVKAELPEIELEIPKSIHLKAEKMIFSENGAKFAILFQETRPTKRRRQVIYIYDFVQKKWSKGVDLSEGFPEELEPLAFNYDGSRLAFRLREDLLILDTVNNKLTHHIKGVGSMTKASFSYDDRFLAFLMNAEWEVPTSLVLLDLKASDQESALIPCVEYSGELKAAGPITWSKDNKQIYYVEEYTWGTVNSLGVLKRYSVNEKKVEEVYALKASSSRVTKYFFSPNGQYLAMIIRELDESLRKSRYGLLIQRQGEFVYGTMLENWQDEVELDITDNFSTAGWIKNEKFYWINRDKMGSKLYIYNLLEKQLIKYNFKEHIYIAPAGMIIKLVR
ncbi:hypothetical protein BBF96_04135 [Anoxybacter fermentans]|uniref:Dipeptidylpeptidase IV N-terminal domain-containing protein n=1 Tax=Anoxybacter fermentans TaxID=1323375 RepID=A0A3Q9HPI1_9FIRM|nr:hypothetical protein [Anoxybacter fermentans]AZR72648.1 hypothetical protein BBF96_04135 [Anoxybacter fermentans]